jgi:hypothetical protein
MALDNIRQRLELAFPGRSSVQLDDADGRFSVRLRFPRVVDEDADPTETDFRPDDRSP